MKLKNVIFVIAAFSLLLSVPMILPISMIPLFIHEAITIEFNLSLIVYQIKVRMQ